ncbi:hypothetical protein Tco_0888359 [Tanacetum coccineum]
MSVLRLGLPCLKGVVIYHGQGDALLHYDAEMELMNLILLSIPNEIYNSVDACTTAKEIWKRVERLMRGTIQNQVDRETRFTNEFDQFIAEPVEALVSVYNHFAQLMNDLERNKMIFPTVTVNAKFLNSLQPEWLKYVTQVRLAKRLTVDSFDDLFDYLQQFEKLVNASREKKLENSHDPLALVAHTGSSSRNTSFYYVTHPTFVVGYDNEYQQDYVQTNFEDPLASGMLLLARSITYNFSNPTNNHLRTSSNTRNQAIISKRREILQLFNATTVVEKDIMLGIVQSQEFGIQNISWNKCNIIFDEPNGHVNSGSVEKDTHVPDLYALEQLARNAYLEAEKQQLFAQKVQQQNTTLTNQLELYKEGKNEDRYHDNILDLEAKLKKNVDLILKLGNSLQGMFMLGPKPLSVYDSQLKHGLGYPNPYTLKQAISQCPKLYLASSLSNSEIPLNVRDTKDTLDDASKSQQKLKEKMNDPIAVTNKQNC